MSDARRWQSAGCIRVSGAEGPSSGYQVRQRRCADCGQWVAGSTSRPAWLTQSCSGSAGRTVGRDTRKVASGPTPGPRVAPLARLQLPGRVRCGCWPRARWKHGSVRGVLGQQASGHRARATDRGSPARGQQPLHLGVIPRWASESVCLYRKPLTDSSSWMCGVS